jgi:hypothetical protein
MRQKAIEDPEFERLKAISELSAIRLRIAAQRLRDRLRFEMRYNPDWQSEPRVPAGGTGGGQWAGGDNGALRHRRRPNWSRRTCHAIRASMSSTSRTKSDMAVTPYASTSDAARFR